MVVREHADGVAESESRAVAFEKLVGPKGLDRVRVGKAGRGGEDLPRVTHGNAVTERLRHRDERSREVHRAEDPHLRRRRERFDEDRNLGRSRLPRRPVVAHHRAAGGELAARVARHDARELGIAEVARRRVRLIGIHEELRTDATAFGQRRQRDGGSRVDGRSQLARDRRHAVSWTAYQSKGST